MFKFKKPRNSMFRVFLCRFLRFLLNVEVISLNQFNYFGKYSYLNQLMSFINRK